MRTKNLDTIRDLFSGRIRDEHLLTDLQMEYLRQIRSAYGMMLDVKPKSYIAGGLMMQFDISQATAYRIISDAEQLFGDINKVNKEWSRHMAVEMAKECYRKAKMLGRVKDMVSALRAFVEATGIMVEDPDLPDFEKLQPSLVVTVLPEGMEDDIRSMLKGGAVDLNTISEKAESLEYVEVDPGRADQEGNTSAAPNGK